MEPSVRKTCPGCGAANPAVANYCSTCGQRCDAAVRSATPASPLMALWRKLSHQMTRRDVRALLGEALHVEAEDARVPGAAETWTYEYLRDASTDPPRRVRGWVKFLISEGRVLAWSEPAWTELDPAPRTDVSA